MSSPVDKDGRVTDRFDLNGYIPPGMYTFNPIIHYEWTDEEKHEKRIYNIKNPRSGKFKESYTRRIKMS